MNQSSKFSSARRGAALGLLSALCAAAASAEMISQPTAVVELFTSQGCSSCPVANAAIVEIDQHAPDVLTLSYGVTYWDYLGWRDTFGHAAFTARQRAYDAALDSGVYTPMMVVAGQSHNPRLSEDALKHLPVAQTVSLYRQTGELCIDADLDPGAKLAIVTYKPGIHAVSVKKGENKGRELTLANVVTDIHYRDWSGTPICGVHAGTGLAVLAHDAKTAAVIGAARLEP